MPLTKDRAEEVNNLEGEIEPEDAVIDSVPQRSRKRGHAAKEDKLIEQLSSNLDENRPVAVGQSRKPTAHEQFDPGCFELPVYGGSKKTLFDSHALYTLLEGLMEPQSSGSGLHSNKSLLPPEWTLLVHSAGPKPRKKREGWKPHFCKTTHTQNPQRNNT
nr:unnamed protein product [Callosobruchus chinensis]